MPKATVNNVDRCMRDNIEFIAKIFAVLIAFVLPLSTTLTDILFVIVPVLYFLAGNWRQKFNFIFSNRIAVLFLLFFALFVVGISYSTAPFNDSIGVMGKYSKLFWTALLMPIFIEDKWRRYAINGFLAAIGILLFLSYLKYFGFIHYEAWCGNVEILKGHIAFNFLMSYAAYLLMQRIITMHGKQRWALVIFLLLISYNILFMTMARSGYVVFAALLLLFFLQRLHWKGLLVACLSIFLLFGSAFSFSKIFQERFAAVVSDIKAYHKTDITSVGLRISFVKNSLKLIEARPILGTGTGSFKHEYAQIKPTPSVLVPNPHNEYLHIGVQFGAVGILILLLNFAAQLWYSRLLPKELGYVAQAVVIAIMVGSFANSWLMDTTQGHFYAYFIALIFAALPPIRERCKMAAH